MSECPRAQTGGEVKLDAERRRPLYTKVSCVARYPPKELVHCTPLNRPVSTVSGAASESRYRQGRTGRTRRRWAKAAAPRNPGWDKYGWAQTNRRAAQQRRSCASPLCSVARVGVKQLTLSEQMTSPRGAGGGRSKRSVASPPHGAATPRSLRRSCGGDGAQNLDQLQSR